MPKKFLANLTMEKILKKAGAERISEEAIEELKKIAEDIAEDIAKHAIELAKHAKRITVKKEDIELAARRYKHG